MPAKKTVRKKTGANHLTKLRPRHAAAFSVLLIAVCVSAAVYVGEHSLSPASANVASALCNATNASNGQTCLNRNKGGTGINTPIIGWYNDHDANEAFAFQYLSAMCPQTLSSGARVSGYVSSNCPFTIGSGLNTKYEGDPIVQIRDSVTGKCVGNYPNQASLGALETCGNASGADGANGTIFVWNVPGGRGTVHWLENRYWTDHNVSIGIDQPAWLCSNYAPAAARQVYTGSPGNGGNCAWTYY